jgi:hypothetical protein
MRSKTDIDWKKLPKLRNDPIGKIHRRVVGALCLALFLSLTEESVVVYQFGFMSTRL